MRQIPKYFFFLLAIFMYSQYAFSALKLDRTRIIYPEEDSSISLEVKNESSDLPYLAQSWLEDTNGKSLEQYLTVIPPLVRVNSGEKLIVRIEKLPDIASLLKDREHLFYYIIREIPPKAEGKNALQLALQTKVKLFYRPEGLPEKKSNKEFYQKVKISKKINGIEIKNTTPYHVILLAAVNLTNKKVIPNVTPLTLTPFQTSTLNLHDTVPKDLGLIFIDDFGGRPMVIYNCTNSCDFLKITN